MEQQQQALRLRPDIEQIRERYEELQAEIRTRLSAEVGDLTWVCDDNERRRGCGPEFGLVADGESRSLARWTAPGNIADRDWDRALRIARETAERYGFGTPEVVLDRPGDHRAVIPDPYGGTLMFGTAVNTVLSMHTGCHPTPS